jgi:hypothetical protein
MHNKETQNQQDIRQGQEDSKRLKKQKYHKPSLTCLGLVVNATHGPSIGNSESGNPLLYKA